MINNTSNTVLNELRQFIYETTMETHSSEKISNSCVKAAIQVLTLNFGALQMYIPSVDPEEKNKEYARIRSDFSGFNQAELVLKYKRSLQNIYKILKGDNTVKSKRPKAIEVIEDYMPAEFVRFGLSDKEAETLAKNIAKYLRQTFPGISVFGFNAYVYE